MRIKKQYLISYIAGIWEGRKTSEIAAEVKESLEAGESVIYPDCIRVSVNDVEVDEPAPKKAPATKTAAKKTTAKKR